MNYYLGIDLGSTTVKCILWNGENILYKNYKRHLSKPRKVLSGMLSDIGEIVKDNSVKAAVAGSAGAGIAEGAGIDFVQEVFAATSYIKDFYPDTDAAIELGGEDAKIIFLGECIEERMNSTCAGGTGAFIDQMAMLLNVTVDELDTLSLQADCTYPIASRCGVFAKTDIQPLINQGASLKNIAASIYGAVVDQTVSGLAQGRAIKGNVMFLGGPLTFMHGLQKAFSKTLKNINPIFPENSEYFVALGAAYYASKLSVSYTLDELCGRIENSDALDNGFESLQPLFSCEAEYEKFKERHEKNSVSFKDAEKDEFEGFLGIDAGSTTTKVILIDKDCNIVYSGYKNNQGNPLEIIKAQLHEIYEKYPKVNIVSSTVTGYGEELSKAAFGADRGVVETVAHYTAAKYFEPDVDFIIDIGGQDMKCFGIKGGTVNSVVLNEACSSGCGSFIETFAKSLGKDIKEFAKMALFAENPVDLGSRCTVFMNSSVKQAQKNGATVSDISAGLAISVVKNALYKVLRTSSAEDLGKKIVVQGGTFLNDAILRSFENETGANVIRPNIAGLMGAFGCALISLRKRSEKSAFISREALKSFKHTSKYVRCGLCQNKCSLTVNEFSNGEKLISGNRCERPVAKKEVKKLPDLVEFKKKYFEKYTSCKGGKTVIGLPRVLNFYDTIPYWFTFFKELGFSVITSPPSTREIYRRGQHTIPSDTVCYGAKLVHGHILSLCREGADYIFYPCMSYNFDEGNTDNFYHCPVVAYYPEVIKSNVSDMGNTKLLMPYLALNDTSYLAKQLFEVFGQMNLSLNDIKSALKAAQKEQALYRESVYKAGDDALRFAEENSLNTIVLAGRPYHADPEINHGINSLVTSLGFVLITEDSIRDKCNYKVDVLNQWTYHARMYNAANFVCNKKNCELVQLVSFGCGLDAVTTDEIAEILNENGKFYTELKIDEINNLSAVRIRLRSLLAAMREREEK